MGPGSSDQGEAGKNRTCRSRVFLRRTLPLIQQLSHPHGRCSACAASSYHLQRTMPWNASVYTTIGQIIDLSDAELLQNPIPNSTWRG